MPAIFQVLAVGKTPRAGLSRGHAIVLGSGMAENPNIVLKLARIAPLDAQMIRMGMERMLERSEGKAARLLETGLGIVDHLFEEDDWCDVEPEVREGLENEPVSQMTVNGEGMPQIWEADVTPNAYWSEKVE